MMADTEMQNEAQIPVDSPPVYTPQANYGGTENAPPNYSDTVGPPPSYEAIFGQLKETRRQSNTIAEFFKKLVILLLGTLGCTICIGVILAIPVSMIAIGSTYLHECKIERYIPIYLIVGGCFGVLKNMINIIQRIKHHREEREDENAKTNPVDAILNCFLVAWFIAGNVWIYQVYGDICPDPEKPCYCHPTLYWYAFWITTSMYILSLTVCCCICCAGICASVSASDN